MAMNSLTAETSLFCAELQEALSAACAHALLVLPRILRRVIKQDRQLGGWGLRTPHAKGWVIARDRLLEIVDREELGLEPYRLLPDRFILLAQPDADTIAWLGPQRVRIEIWRLLFHARVHEILDDTLAAGRLLPDDVRERIYQLGPVAFDEIRDVLRQEHFLVNPDDSAEVYSEFVAVYLELRHFAPSLLGAYFPALADLSAVDRIVAQDVDGGRLFEECRLPDTPNPEDETGVREWDDWPADESAAAVAAQAPAYPRDKFPRLLRRADKADGVGNLVGAMIYRVRALRCAPRERVDRMQAAIRATLNRLLERLQRALEIPAAERDAWREPLLALVYQTAHGIWPPESRLLYDLQKVCVDCERGVYTVDLVEWILSLGRRPIKRALPSQRDVLMSKHLRSAAARLPSVRLSVRQRRCFGELLRAATHHAELRLRERFRPLLADALTAVGLRPRDLPERVSRDKLVEELLDRIVESGFLAMGDLRDALSRNNLKLPDFARPLDLLRGDQLLRADRRLSRSLDGVHRRGEFYLRWMQQLSSLAFGTRTGRLLTRWAAVPFGGAYVVLAFLAHEFRALAAADEPVNVLVLGSFVAGMVNIGRFREAVVRWLKLAGRAARRWLLAPLMRLVRAEWVQRLLRSRWFRHVWRLLLKPLLLTALVWPFLPMQYAGSGQSLVAAGGLFLVVSLAVNSRFGRNFQEVALDWIVQTWHRFGIRILTGLFWMVVDLFKGLMEGLERLLYTVDEWLRFRTGETRLSAVVKGLLGAGWFFVTYVVRFGVNLLIEPQVNPIKHFPVVTVSHKLIWPFLPTLGGVLALTMDKALAYTVATAIIWVVPGIFGFLVWELKENWRLYEANRSRDLRPVPIGHHGETMARLLRWGFHSGTLPKRFAKLRRAERKARLSGQWQAVRKHRDALQGVAHHVGLYVQREFAAFLALHPAWEGHGIGPVEIQVGPHEIEASLHVASLGAAPLEIAWQVESDWLLVVVREPGWLAVVDPQRRQLVANALAGLYATSGVELVRQQIEDVFPAPQFQYRLDRRGLVVSLGDQRDCELLYPLREGELLRPKALAGSPAASPPVLSRRQVVFSSRPIAWRDWCEAWNESVADPAAAKPLVAFPLLPGDRPTL